MNERVAVHVEAIHRADALLEQLNRDRFHGAGGGAQHHHIRFCRQGRDIFHHRNIRIQAA